MLKILKLILFLILLIIIFVIWYINFRRKKAKTSGYVWVGEGSNPFEEKKEEEKDKKE